MFLIAQSANSTWNQLLVKKVLYFLFFNGMSAIKILNKKLHSFLYTYTGFAVQQQQFLQIKVFLSLKL